MEELLRKIPQMDKLLQHQVLEGLRTKIGHEPVKTMAQIYLEGLRGRVRAGAPMETLDQIAEGIEQLISKRQQPYLRRVLNATGIALHTNLGRAPLPSAALQAVLDTACGYCDLEYDLEKGQRGNRSRMVELLSRICGCESAMAVNNNAAALLLAASTLAKGKNVVISRGELVEIGDSFRVPEILEQSGAALREVGATNKTHLRDYQKALEQGNVGMVLKVHTSNFQVVGFTKTVSAQELAPLCHQWEIPLVVDLGSGLILGKENSPISQEPTLPEMLEAGADVVCFSGDKLLGGPQAGILAGRRELIFNMSKNPLARALRLDKMTLAALEATLRLYESPQRALTEIPVLASLNASPDKLRRQAEELLELLKRENLTGELVPHQRPVGGGSAPGKWLDGWAVALHLEEGLTPEKAAACLRQGEPPVVARIHQGKLLLDVAALLPGETILLAKACGKALKGDKEG